MAHPERLPASGNGRAKALAEIPALPPTVPAPKPAPTPAPKPARQFDPVPVREGTRHTRYLAQSIVLEEIGTSGLVRGGILAIGLAIAAFLVWAGVTHIEEVAVTFGEVVPAGQVQTVQHLEGGIVREILIEDGSLVEKGQLLVRLDSATAEADLKQMRSRFASLQLDAARLKAFAEGHDPDFSFIGPGHEDLVANQLDIHRIQKDSLESRRNVILNQIAQRKSEEGSLAGQEKSLRENIRILSEELEMRETLFRKGLQPKLAYLEVQRNVNQAHGDHAKVQAEMRRAREAREEAENRVVELEARRREETLATLGPIVSEISELRESIAKNEDRSRRLEIGAPVRGIVKGLKTHTRGGVLAPGAPLMEIVPLDKELTVETRISTRDVGHVQAGQPVSVKVTAYDFARYGALTGALKGVSATTFLQEDGEPYYKGIVVLDQNHLGSDPTRNRILPGMTVQADIRTGEKTLLQYLLKPVYSYADQAFKER